MAVSGSGGASADEDRTGRSPQSTRWISYADLQVNAQVTSVRVAERLLVVPWHGHVLVVWSGRQPPRVEALDEGGKLRAEMRLASTH